MSSWIAFAAPLATGVALIALLGLPAAFALRLRGFAIPLVAVPAAFAVIAVSTIVAPVVGLGWSLGPPLVLAFVLAIVLFVLRRWLGAPGGRGFGARDLWTSLGSAAIGGAIIALFLVMAMRTPDAISQTFDVNFHLNAVPYVMESGSASPFTMDLTSPGTPIFYPTLWHSFVALIVQITGATVPAATNAAVLVVSSIVWPIGAIALGRAVAGPSLRVTLISGALVAAFPTFPLFLAAYGVIYPNLMALALMPFPIVAGLQLLNLGQARRAFSLPTGTQWLLLVGGFGAAVLAHPNVIHGLLVWAAVPLIIVAIRAFRGRPVQNANGLLVLPTRSLGLRRAGAAVGLIALVVAVVAAWVAGRTTDNIWQGFYGPRSAALQLIGGTPHLEGHAWALAVLILFGALLAWRHRSLRWILGSAATLAFFYYIADGFPSADWRTFFLSPWYNDPRRLAALVPFGAMPLAVLGASALWAMLRPGVNRFSRVSSDRPRRSIRVVAVVALLALIGAGQAGNFSAVQVLNDSYDVKKPLLLTEDEEALLDRIDDEVPEGEVIANNPLNGSALVYAVSDRQALFPHSGGLYDPIYYELVDTLVSDPVRACEVSKEIDVRFVLDFGMDYVLDDETPRGVPFRHMKDLQKSPILEKIDSEGDSAALFEITGC